jgi:hypothetical protein
MSSSPSSSSSSSCSLRVSLAALDVDLTLLEKLTDAVRTADRARFKVLNDVHTNPTAAFQASRNYNVSKKILAGHRAALRKRFVDGIDEREFGDGMQTEVEGRQSIAIVGMWGELEIEERGPEWQLRECGGVSTFCLNVSI